MFIPTQYKLIGIVAIVLAAYFYGLISGNQRSAVVIDGYVNQVEKLQLSLREEQQNIKEKIVVKYLFNKNTIDVKEKEYVFIADNIVPPQFNLSNGWVYLHDQSALGLDADRTLSSDATASDIKDNVALGTITENYSTCKRTEEKLIALQTWVTETQKLFNEKSKNNSSFFSWFKGNDNE